MRVLIDTNVLSELRKQTPSDAVVNQVRSIGADNTFLSSITIGELVYGITKLPHGKKRQELESWLSVLEQVYGDRILPFDTETAHIWGEIVAKQEALGHPIPIQDSQIAATGLRHGLHIMTRNTRDFENTGVLLINPWDNT